MLLNRTNKIKSSFYIGCMLFVGGSFIFFIIPRNYWVMEPSSKLKTPSRPMFQEESERSEAPETFPLKKTIQIQKLMERVQMLDTLVLKQEYLKTVPLSYFLEILNQSQLQDFYLEALEGICLHPIPPSYEENVAEAIYPYLSNLERSLEDPKATLFAIQIAEKLSNQEEVLMACFENATNVEIRSTALKAVSRYAPETLFSTLLKIVQTENAVIPEKSMIQAALYGLRYYEKEQASTSLIHALSLPSDELANTAIESLAFQPAEQVLKQFGPFLKNATERQKRNAYKVVATSGQEEYLALIEAGLSDKNQTIQYLSLRGLAKINSKKTLPFICEQLLSKKISLPYKKVLLEEVSVFLFRTENTALKEDSEKELSVFEGEALILETLGQLTEPSLKIDLAKKLLQANIYFSPWALIDLLELNPDEVSEEFSFKDVNQCRIQAWQLLIYLTQQYLPLDKQIWEQYLREAGYKSL